MLECSSLITERFCLFVCVCERRVSVQANSLFQVCSVLIGVCKKEGLVLPNELARQIAEKSGRNLRKALLMCEACRVQQ